MRVLGSSRGRLVAVLASLLVLSAPSGAARAEVVQKGKLRVSVAGKLSPKALPRQGAAPVSVSLGGRITTTDGSDPPQLRSITMAINRDGRFDFAGLPTCALDEIQPATSQEALAACRDALVGEGSFLANVQFPLQSPFPSDGKVLMFNGRLGGQPVILAHVYGSEPVPTSYTLPFKIRRSRGTFGTVLAASLPRITGEWGFVTGIELTLGRHFAHHGSYLSAGCPAPAGFPGAVFPLVRTDFRFAGGLAITSTLNRDCTVSR
jgi:hypothetical protein